jgi:hypothetical protein
MKLAEARELLRRVPIEPLAAGAVVALFVARYTFLVMVASIMQVRDPDIWWVAAAGRDMLTTGTVPAQNLYSFVDSAHPWVMHEWLFGVPYALLLSRFGPPAFDALALGLAVLALGLILLGTVGRSRLLFVGVLLAFMASCGFGQRFLSARPTGVSLLFPLVMTLVAFRPRFSRWSLALSVVTEWLWANAHGSFPLGVVLLGVAAIDQPLDRGRRLVAAGAAALATLANPYGLALHRLVWHYLRADEDIFREIKDNIVEFHSIFHSSSAVAFDEIAFLAILALAVFGMFWTRKYRARALLCAGLMALAARQSRQCEIAGLVTCLLLVPYLDDRFERRRLFHLRAPRWRGRVAVVALVPALVFGGAAFQRCLQTRTPEAWLRDDGAGLRALAAAPDGAHVFVPFSDAGRAIWYGWPRGIRVYYDPRNDCYAGSTFREFRDLDAERAQLPPDAGERLARAGTDAAVLLRSMPLAQRLAQDRAWTLAREEESWMLYRRVVQ